jgi:hypothetical protein
MKPNPKTTQAGATSQSDSAAGFFFELYDRRYFLLIFLVVILIGSLLWDQIVLPFHNPNGMTGPLTAIRFNPDNK